MSSVPQGRVYFVGAGPGDPELLTVKALLLLRRADVVLHDDLVPDEIVSLAGPHATVISVGKRCGAKMITQAEINRLMISFAQRGSDVVRLKSGDPGIFGRLGEELDALEAADVDYQVVPGVTVALAAAASIGASLTDRRTSSKVVIVSGHRANENGSAEHTDWRQFLANDATLVVYMPGRDVGALANQLIEAGLPATTPSVLISRVSRLTEQQSRCTLGELCSATAAEAPAILMVGHALVRARTFAKVEMQAKTHPQFRERKF